MFVYSNVYNTLNRVPYSFQYIVEEAGREVFLIESANHFYVIVHYDLHYSVQYSV